MANIARRPFLLWSVSATAAAAAAFVLYAQAVKPYISFGQARSLVMERINAEMELSQRDYGIKYTTEQMKDIQNRLWDTTQVALSKYYTSKEAP